MPDFQLLDTTGKKCVGYISIGGEYKPGDPAPSGYSDKQEWARVQMKAGLKQRRCSQCSRWWFPQEIATTEQRPYVKYKTKRDARNETNPVVVIENVITCLECAAKKTATPTTEPV